MTVQAYSISAHAEVRGLDVNVGDYRWSAGEQITALEPQHILRWRTFPAQLAVSARLRTGPQCFGQLMFFPADVQVDTDRANQSERTRNVMCRFDPGWFYEVAKLPTTWHAEDMVKCLDLKNIRIEQAIQRLGVEVANPGFASKLLIECLGTVIAVEIARHFSEKSRDLRVRTREGVMSQTDVHRVHEYVDSMTKHNPSIDEIAAVCNISPAHLRRSFKKTTGKTVHQYVDSIRLKKAQSLLSDTDLPLKEISYRLGFADSSTFSSTFRKSAGESPSGYRYRCRN